MVRKAVPKKIEADVLAACRRRCAICFGLNRVPRRRRGQIAHLDRNSANSSFDNLVYLCMSHHDEYDSKTSQSKGFTPDEVRRFRQELVAAVAAEYQPPRLAHTTDRAAPDPAPERLTIRELSGGDFSPPYRTSRTTTASRKQLKSCISGSGRATLAGGRLCTACPANSRRSSGLAASRRSGPAHLYGLGRPETSLRFVTGTW